MYVHGFQQQFKVTSANLAEKIKLLTGAKKKMIEQQQLISYTKAKSDTAYRKGQMSAIDFKAENEVLQEVIYFFAFCESEFIVMNIVFLKYKYNNCADDS